MNFGKAVSPPRSAARSYLSPAHASPSASTFGGQTAQRLDIQLYEKNCVHCRITVNQRRRGRSEHHHNCNPFAQPLRFRERACGRERSGWLRQHNRGSETRNGAAAVA